MRFPWLRPRHLTALLGCTLVAACTTLPVQLPQPASDALRPSEIRSSLGRHAAALATDGEDAFQVVIDPHQALLARFEMIERAEQTIDLQYFIWNDDESGRALLSALFAAADRGVRVRLLLDHLYSGAVESRLQALATHAHADVRLFNPLTTRAGASAVGKLLGSLSEFGRIRHRMHNKLMVADNSIALTGGRNIGDEYLTEKEGNFLDVDVIAVGPAVQRMSASFDEYWNSEFAFSMKFDWRSGTRVASVGHAARPADTPAVHPRTTGPVARMLDGQGGLHRCPARVHADAVSKAAGISIRDSTFTLHQQLIDLFVSSKRSIYTASPYFVRGRSGVERIAGLIARGVRIQLLTNSLATTDEPLAHAVYLRYRKDLLEAGLNIREMIAARDGLPVAGFRASRLHAKMSVIDERWVYIGSLNFTRRSENLNTEIGLILDCPRLARELIDLMNTVPAYELRMARSPAGIEWVDRRAQPEAVWDAEPGASAWLRFISTILDPLIPEEEI